MEQEKYRESESRKYYPEALMYVEVINWGMKDSLKKELVVEHGFNHLFRFPKNLRDVIKGDDDMWRLHYMILGGFRTFKDELPRNVGPVIHLYTGCSSKKILSERIDMLIELSNTLDTKNMFGAIYTGKDSGFVIPVGLESDNGTDDEMSDAEFLSEVVLSGFEVSDIN